MILTSTMPGISPARKIAFEVLLQVHRGGYASDLLLAAAAPLDSRDAGLASEIVFGCLRFQSQLDFLIGHFGARTPRLDPEVRIALRMAIYQLRYLDRVPAHAAVTESVELVKQARKRSAAGMVNAVSRKVHRNPVPWPDRAVELAHPEWLLASWEAQFGAAAAERIAHAFLDPPETWVRAPGGNPPSGTILEPAGLAGAYRLVSGNPGPLRIQDVGSQSIVPMLELQPGHRFLDVCAAPGNKTAQALETPVEAIACDLYPRRLNALAGLNCRRVVLDATVSLPFHVEFDRILVDAPCSGTGTLGRNPEIKWRLEPSHLLELHSLQVRILRNSLEKLAPGGLLVYSTCSLQREENEAVVLEVLGGMPEQVLHRIPGRDPGDGFFAAVIPSKKPPNG
jgi:16S rRNA (cytosine967-C5)-methyltransferase